MSVSLMTLEIHLEGDVVLARQRARQIAGLLGFAHLDQTRIATATSEVARNTLQNGGGGRLEFLVESGPSQSLTIVIRERGTGLKDLQAIVHGQYGSPEAVPPWVRGAQRMMDRFSIEPGSGGGATVAMAKKLPPRSSPLASYELGRISDNLARSAPQGLLEELQQQNQELLSTLQELRDRQAEIAQMHSQELDETNRGVVALYTQLDEHTKSLKRLSDLKSQFLSEMSHELRSPLNSIRSLTGFLLARSDGELTPEQEKQVHFIRQAAEGLSTLVDDSLDLAKVEAGKAVLRIGQFEVKELFETLKGTIRPIIDHDAVSLVFDSPSGIGPLQTDEGKVLQILRNFLSNAVKYTVRGQIRVAAQSGPENVVVFSVKDTGIGVAAEDLGRIFEDFGQVDSELQKRIKGTGLGLPLARKLASLLGGSVSVRSQLGFGSTFYAVIPRTCPSSDQGGPSPALRWAVDPARSPVLLVDDDPGAVSIYDKYLEKSSYQNIRARTLDDARSALREFRPLAVILVASVEGNSGESFLREIKSKESSRGTPVLVVTSSDDIHKFIELGADDACKVPVSRDWLVQKLRGFEAQRSIDTALIVDDRERDRYLIKESLLALGEFDVIEAESGQEALRRLRSARPAVIFLDLVLPDMSGFEILDHLKRDEYTKDIPVIINTSRILGDEERQRLAEKAVDILAKGNESREQAIAQVRGSLQKAGLHT
jgi:signal transduction histidine kinase/CheY-like chemotaxis protein